MAARNYSNIAVATTLSSGISDSITSLDVASATGWPAAPFILVIDKDTSDEELILVDNKSGTTFSSLTRGFGGTSAVAHNAAVAIEHVVAATDIALIWSHDHDGDFATVDHADLGSIGVDDHHAQVHTLVSSDHIASGLTTGHALVATGATTFGFAAVDHGNLDGLADDDHSQYLNVSRHDSDDHSGLVTAANLIITEAQISDLDHDDANAIHDNVAGEINAVTVKGTPVTGDLVLIEDSAASNAKKKATLGSIVSALTEVDHGALTGLGDDDHTQYLTVSRHDADNHSSLSASEILSGTLAFARHPTGTSSSTLAIGNHLHTSEYVQLGGSTMTGLLVTAGGMAINSSTAVMATTTERVSIGDVFIVGVRSSAAPFFAGRNSDGPSYEVWRSGSKTGGIGSTSGTLTLYNASDVRTLSILDGGSSSSVYIRDGLTAIGDQTTLRIARGTGTGVVPIGYHSSSLEHKTQVKTLNASKYWDRSNFMKIRPITYTRKDGPDEGMREFSFGAEELDAISPMLTTGGDKAMGESVSNTGLMAVVVDFLQYHEERITTLEKRLSRA